MALGSESRKRSSEDRNANPKRRDRAEGPTRTSTVPPAVVAGSKKRSSGDQGNQDEDRSRSRTAASSTVAPTSRARPPVVPVAPPPDPVAEEMDDQPIPLNLERERAEKRRASKEVEDEYQTEEEKKAQRVNSLQMEDALMSTWLLRTITCR